jgi:hypothetical protein
MISKNTLLVITAISIIAILPFQISRAQVKDNIPRNRLVTDEELLHLLDFSNKDLSNVEAAIKTKEYNTALINLSAYFRNRTSPKYFFDSKTVRLDIENFRKSYPEEVNNIKKRADEFIDSYGTDLTWSLPAVDKHGRAYTPNTIRQLSRFAQSYDFALSYYIENNNSHRIDPLIAQLKDFINDYEKGIAEKGGNDVFERFYAGHRTRNLLLAHNLLLNSPDYDWQKQIFMLKIFLLHGARLIDACKKFNWGNHQLHGLAGLYEMTIMYPEFPVMNLWNDMALKTIMEHITKEIKDDGFQFERASHYFKLDIMNYFRIHKISALNNKKLPDLFEKRFHKMFDAIMELSRPDKSLPVLQDAQAFYQTQLDSLDNNDAAELSDPKESLFMSLGAAEFNNPGYKYFSSEQLPPDLFWFFSEEERDKYSALPIKTPEVKSIALTDSKYFVMRTGWDKNNLHMVIDGGLAEYKPDHTHGGILGIALYGFGNDLLPTYRVHYSDPSYIYLKNSMAKNVAMADNIPQGKGWISNSAKTGFGIWNSLPDPTVNDWITGNNFDYFSGSHNGYIDDSVNYDRSVFFFKPLFFVVADNFKSNSYHSYQQIWQGKFNPLNDCNGAVKISNTGKLFIIQSDYADMNIVPFSKYNINSIKFEKTGVKDYFFSTILYPISINDSGVPVVKQFTQKECTQVIVTKNNDKGILFFNVSKEIKSDDVISDAEFVCASYKNDILNSFLLYKGSYCEFEKVSIKCESKSVLEISKDENGKWSYTTLKGTPGKVIISP